MISAANLTWMWQQVDARIGTPYTWGGTLDPNDPSRGTDCSGAVGFVIEALRDGPRMSWDRPFWTGTFAGMRPGDVAQPWGLVCIPGPFSYPADAAAVVAINQGPTADTSHMIVRVLDKRFDPAGIDIEDAGNGLQKYDRAASIDDPQFNQWFYLPGPLEKLPGPPPVVTDKKHLYARAVIEEGQKRGISRKGICIALTVPFVESGWKMYANAGIPASMNLPHDAVGFDHDSVGLFQQRLAWGPIEALMDPNRSAGLFYDGGAAGQPGLTDQDYDSNDQEPGEYAADVQQPAAEYRYRYQEHWGDANALYDEIVGTGEDDDFMGALTAQEQRAMYDAIMGQRPSRSPLRHVGEGNVGSILDLEWNMDGSVHVLVIWLLAAYLKSPDALSLLHEVAGNTDPNRHGDAMLAQAMLNKIQMMDDGIGCPVADYAPATVVPTETVPATRPIPPAPESSGLSAELSQLRDTIHSLTDILNRLK